MRSVICWLGRKIQTRVCSGWRLLAAPCCWFLRHCVFAIAASGSIRVLEAAWQVEHNGPQCPPPSPLPRPSTSFSLSFPLSLREGLKECVWEQMIRLQQVEVSGFDSQRRKRRKNGVSQTLLSVCVDVFEMPFHHSSSCLSAPLFHLGPGGCDYFICAFSACIVTNTVTKTNEGRPIEESEENLRTSFIL